MNMGNERIQRLQKRRILSDNGWLYFCNQCGDYKTEAEFYKSKSTPFGVTGKCRLHFKYEDPADPEFEYLKLNPITDEDLDQTKIVLEKLGFKFGPDQPPVWIQFNKKHNIE